jgi:hypothetical protein
MPVQRIVPPGPELGGSRRPLPTRQRGRHRDGASIRDRLSPRPTAHPVPAGRRRDCENATDVEDVGLTAGPLLALAHRFLGHDAPIGQERVKCSCLRYLWPIVRLGTGTPTEVLLGTATSLSPGTAQPPVFTGRELV